MTPPDRDERRQEVTVDPDEVKARRSSTGLAVLRPEHLYRAAALLFLFALFYHYFETIARILLIAFAAGVLAVVLNAIISAIPLQRRWTAGLLGLLILGAFGTLVWFAAPAVAEQFRSFMQQLPDFQKQIREWGEQIRQQTGLNIDLVGQRTSRFAENILMGSGNQVLGRARGLLELLILPLIILFGGLFAAGKPNDRLLTPILRAVPRDMRPAYHRMFELLGLRLLAWVKGVLLSMLIIGALSTAAFYFIGLKYALLLGIFNGLAEFVPLVGPWVGGATAVAVAFLEDPNKALWTAGAVLAIQQLESNVITPLVMASVADVHPFVTLFAVILFGSLFGFLGVLLALPLVLLFWTVIEVLWVERAIDTDKDRIDPIVEE